MPEILCNRLNNISWQRSAVNTFSLNASSHIFRISIPENIHLLEQCYSQLDENELKRAVSYRQEKDRNRFILNRGMLRHILALYLKRSPAGIQLLPGQNKKPKIADSVHLHYNVSHSGDWILIALSGAPIGIDVEYINPDFNFSEVLPVSFSEQEKKVIDSSIHPLNDFYGFWTRKEALLKATSKGMDDDLPHIPCLDGPHTIAASFIGSADNWTVSSFSVDDQYVAAIAHKQPSVSKPLFFDIKDLPAAS